MKPCHEQVIKMFLEKYQPPEYQETLLILSVAMMKHNGPDE